MLLHGENHNLNCELSRGLMVAQFTKRLRGLPVDADLQVNLIAVEMVVAGK